MEFIAATQPGHRGDENALPPRKLLFAEVSAARMTQENHHQLCAPSAKRLLNHAFSQGFSEKLEN
jgi:hypothetical protein